VGVPRGPTFQRCNKIGGNIAIWYCRIDTSDLPPNHHTLGALTVKELLVSLPHRTRTEYTPNGKLAGIVAMMLFGVDIVGFTYGVCTDAIISGLSLHDGKQHSDRPRKRVSTRVEM
jgi:hypothetical protein